MEGERTGFRVPGMWRLAHGHRFCRPATTGFERMGKAEPQLWWKITVTPKAWLGTAGSPEAFLVHPRIAVGAVDAHQQLCVRRDGQHERIACLRVAMSREFDPDLSFLGCVVADFGQAGGVLAQTGFIGEELWHLFEFDRHQDRAVLANQHVDHDSLESGRRRPSSLIRFDRRQDHGGFDENAWSLEMPSMRERNRK